MGNLRWSTAAPAVAIGFCRRFWRSLCELTGLADLADDPKYDTVKKRAERESELVPKLRAALEARTALEWENHFGDRVPCGAVRSMDEMFEHPQTLAEGLVTTVRHPTVGAYRGLSRPVKLGASPGPEPFAAPSLGQHTADVLRRHGYSDEQLERLRMSKVIP